MMNIRSLFLIDRAVASRLFFAGLLAVVASGALCADVRVGFTQDALTLDPANHRKRETETVIRNLYDAVMTQTSKSQTVPEIAESVRQIDPVTYEVKLRKGVKFHSGDEMTADDVKFTYDRLTKDKAMGGQTSPRQSLVGPLVSTDVVDRTPCDSS